MSKLVEYELEGGSIVIEVDEKISKKISPASGKKKEETDKAVITFEDSLEKVRPVADTIVQKFKNLSHEPDNVEVEFGLKMNTTSGAIIASASVEANFKIKLMWSKGNA